MATISDLLSAFAVTRPHFEGGVMSLEQALSPAVADHRGRIDMPAYAVMVESVTSGAFWYSLGEPVGSVQSWLSLTSAAPVVMNQRLLATSRLLHRDDLYGTLTVQITNDHRDVVCAGVGRCVRVNRTSDALAAVPLAPTTADDGVVSAAAATALPPPIDPGLDGKQILTAVSEGRISAGPLCELLCATVTSIDDRVRLTVSPQPWMANPLGTMQGGVVTAIVALACIFAGQLYASPGQQYSLVDFAINFFNSPPVDGGDLRVATATDKLGRRIGTVSATMAGPDGVPLARAIADIQYY